MVKLCLLRQSEREAEAIPIIAFAILFSVFFFMIFPGQIVLFFSVLAFIFVVGMAYIIWRYMDAKRAARINREFNSGKYYCEEEDAEPVTEPPWTTPAYNPEMFESQVGEMFRRYGYRVLETPYQGDHGIDLKIMTPTEYAIVQCKRWDKLNKIGEPYVRDFFGTMQNEGCDVGYIVTTSDFTKPAYDWAKGKKIVLINGDSLQRMLEETEAMTGAR